MTTRTIHLHGGLHPEPVTMTGDTLASLVDGLSRQIPGLKPTVHGRKMIQIKGAETEEDLYRHLGDQEVIHIYPVLEGDKGKFFQVIVGATLIALSFVPGLQGIAFLGTNLGTFMAQAGMMMMLGGIAQMLAPTPDLAMDDGKQSRILTSGRNTVAIGTRIPILYGEFRVGGHYLSVNVNANKSDGND